MREKLTVHDPSWEEIVKRRFGSRHDKPCARPEVLTCAMPECQLANRCRHNPTGGAIQKSRDLGR